MMSWSVGQKKKMGCYLQGEGHTEGLTYIMKKIWFSLAVRH